MDTSDHAASDGLDNSFHEPTGGFKSILARWESQKTDDEGTGPNASNNANNKPTPVRRRLVNPFEKVEEKDEDKEEEDDDDDAENNGMEQAAKPPQAQQPKMVPMKTAPLSSISRGPVKRSGSFCSVSTSGTSKKTMRQPKNVYQKPLKKSSFRENTLNNEFPKEDQKLILRCLLKNFVFEGRSREELRALLPSFELHTCKKGEIVTKQGDSADYFYILKKGSVKFVVDGNDVDRLSGAGGSFGELALLYSTPRAASVVTTKESQFFRLHQLAFRAALQTQSEATVDRKAQLLKGVSFLNALSEAELRKIAAAMTTQVLKTDQILVEKGTKNSNFWIIDEGKVLVPEGGAKYRDKTVGPGDYFGEKALTADEVVMEDVTVSEKGLAFTIDRTTFERLTGGMTSLVMKAQDASKLADIDIIANAQLDPLQLGTLASLVSKDTKYTAGKHIVRIGSKMKPALYFVREGKVELMDTKNIKTIVSAGGYFGRDAMRSPEAKNNINITSVLSVKVLEDCVIATLTLRDCRTVFDTDSFSADPSERVDPSAKVHNGKKNGAKLLEPKQATAVVSDEEKAPVKRKMTRRASTNCAKQVQQDEVSVEEEEEDKPVPAKYKMKRRSSTKASETVEITEKTPDKEPEKEAPVEKTKTTVVKRVVKVAPVKAKQDRPKAASKPTEERVKIILPKHPKSFKRHLILGEGTFGQVWLSTYKKEAPNKKARPYALKIQSKFELVNEGQVTAAVREKGLMEMLRHPFIIRQYKTYQDEDFLYTVMEFVQGGELFSIMHTDEEASVVLSEDQVRFYTLGIADALACMHRRKVVFRDLKPENIMIDEKGYPVVIDFGFAKVVTDKTFTLCGTPGYEVSCCSLLTRA